MQYCKFVFAFLALLVITQSFAEPRGGRGGGGGGRGEEEVAVEAEGGKGVAEVQVLERVLEVRLHSHLVSPRFRQLEELAQDLQQK